MRTPPFGHQKFRRRLGEGLPHRIRTPLPLHSRSNSQHLYYQAQPLGRANTRRALKLCPVFDGRVFGDLSLRCKLEKGTLSQPLPASDSQLPPRSKTHMCPVEGLTTPSRTVEILTPGPAQPLSVVSPLLAAPKPVVGCVKDRLGAVDLAANGPREILMECLPYGVNRFS